MNNSGPGVVLVPGAEGGRLPTGLVVGGLLILAVVAAHGGAVHGVFHYDDRESIVENPGIRSWHPMFYLTSSLAGSSSTAGGGYRPLTIATFAVNYAVGLLNPYGYLVVNLALHLAVSWMVFVLGRRLLGDDWVAGVAAVIYGIHPVNAEAVNYVVARSSLLSTFGVLITCWAFVRHRDGGGGHWLVVGLIAFIGALLSKEAGVAAVILMAGYEWVFRPNQGWVKRLAPYGVVVFLYLILWKAMVGGEGAGAVYPAWAFLEVAGRSLALWVWPWPLGLEHPTTFTERFDPLLAATLSAGAAAMTAAVLYLRRRAPVVAWGLVWIVAGLAPLLPLPWLTTRALFQENRLACSAVALAWLTAVVLSRAAARVPRVVAIIVGMSLVIGAVGVDRARSYVWNDDVRLWQEVVSRWPANVVGHQNLGAAFFVQKDYEHAETSLRRAFSMAPRDARAAYALGLTALRRARFEEARGWFLKAVALAPESWTGYHGLAETAHQQGDFTTAAKLYRQTIELNPRNKNAYAMLGVLAQQDGDDDAAEASYQAALQIDPDSPELLNNLGTIAMKRRDWNRALHFFTASADLDAHYLEPVYNRALALDALGRQAEARGALELVLQRLPPHAEFEGRRRAVQAMLDEGRP